MPRASVMLVMLYILSYSKLATSPNSSIGIARYHAAIEAHLRRTKIAFTFLHPHSFTQNLIFDSGTIREQGSHQELAELKGEYYHFLKKEKI